jgi:maltodextrin utilization protein YvdJ
MESEGSETMNPIEARAALDSVGDAQRALALKATYCPLWRHAAFAAIMAALVLGPGFGMMVQIPTFVLAMAATALLVIDDRRRYGVFVNGYRKGPTLLVALALPAVMLATVFAEIHAHEHGLSLATKLGIAALAFLFAFAASIAWNRIYRRELLKGAA